jgi:hypothetical protein
VVPRLGLPLNAIRYCALVGDRRPILRFFGQKAQPIQLSVLELAGGAHCAVAGESYYGEAIAKTVQTCWADDEEDRVFNAILVPEPNNEFDANAVGVWSSCGKLGHLPRDQAVIYRPLFDEIRRRGYDGGACEAVMRGGKADKPNIGIVLRLSRSEICLAELD